MERRPGTGDPALSVEGPSRLWVEPAKFQTDPDWRDCLLFYEYFHGDNGAGIGASHQTGWTELVAFLLHYFGRMQAADVLQASDVLDQASGGS